MSPTSHLLTRVPGERCWIPKDLVSLPPQCGQLAAGICGGIEVTLCLFVRVGVFSPSKPCLPFVAIFVVYTSHPLIQQVVLTRPVWQAANITLEK